jgi:hypothetical protein
MRITQGRGGRGGAPSGGRPDAFTTGRATVSSSVSPDAHAVAWAAGPGMHDRDDILDGAARMIEQAEMGRRFWRAVAIINGAGFGGTLAALAVVIWG